MASRTAGTSPQETGVVLNAPDTFIQTESGGGSESSSQFQGISSPEAMAVLLEFIRQTAGGGTEEQRRQRAERNTEIQRTRALSGDYTKQSAFADAAELMAQNLRQSLEKNMPAISKSIQGAGTSSSSMQGLLSQKLATESAQAASALGAEQAKSYGAISAQLQSVLEALTRGDPTAETNLLKALELTRVSSQASSRVTKPTMQTTPIDQGNYFQPISQSEPQAMAPVASSGYSGYTPLYNQPASQGYGYVENTTTGSGTIFGRDGTIDTFSYAPQQEQSLLDQQYAEGWGYGD